MFVDVFLRELTKEKLQKLAEKKDNEIWVSELVMCRRKAEFTKIAPLTPTKASLILGTLVHMGLEKWLEQHYSACTEVELERKLDDYIIKGRADAVVDNTVIEIKTAKSVSKPYEHHLLQLRLYMWLGNYSRGLLIYVTPEVIKEFEVTTAIDTAKVKELLYNWTSPRYAWECKYCDYAEMCSKRV